MRNNNGYHIVRRFGRFCFYRVLGAVKMIHTGEVGYHPILLFTVVETWYGSVSNIKNAKTNANTPQKR